MNTQNPYTIEIIAYEQAATMRELAHRQHLLRREASTGKLNRLPVILCSFIVIGAALIYFVS